MDRYPTPPGDSVEPIVREIKGLRTRARAGERPTGTSIAGLVAQVQAAIVNIGATVTAYLASGFTTGSMTATGNVTAANVTGTNNVTGLNVFAQSLATNITAGRVTLWGRLSDGYIATATSSERFKSNIRPVDRDPRVLMQIAVSYYEYTAECRRRDDPSYEFYVGPEYHVGTNIGVIAERLHELGLWEYVVYERDVDDNLILTDAGEPIPNAVHDILLPYLIIPFVQMQERRMDALAARLNALDGRTED